MVVCVVVVVAIVVDFTFVSAVAFACAFACVVVLPLVCGVCFMCSVLVCGGDSVYDDAFLDDYDALRWAAIATMVVSVASARSSP